MASADAQVKAAFAAFDKAYGHKPQATSQIAEIIRTLTAAATETTTGADARSVKTAELAVEQARIRLLVNGLQDAQRALAGAVNVALDHLDSAIAPAQPTASGDVTSGPAKTTAD